MAMPYGFWQNSLNFTALSWLMALHNLFQQRCPFLQRVVNTTPNDPCPKTAISSRSSYLNEGNPVAREILPFIVRQGVLKV